MTATTTTPISVATPRARSAAGHVLRLARAAGAMLAAAGSRWNDFVDAGQLGPSEDTMISRHTGGRI